METITPNTPIRSTASGIHRGIWIGGGLMALTIIALATTLVVRGNSATDSATPLAGTDAAAVAPANSSVAQTADQPVQPVATQTPAPQAAPVVRHPPVHHEAEARRDGANGEPQRVASVPVCATCGVIESYSTVQVKGENNGIGAVAGGVGGALIGSKIAGRGNHTLGGVIGAVGGGLLGNAVESHERTVTEYDVHVRMTDGSVRTVRQASAPTVGARVRVDGNVLHAAPDAQG